MTKIEKAKLEAEKRATLLYVLERIYESVVDRMHWDSMELLTDENGDAIRDENGDRQWRDVIEDDWQYSEKIKNKEAYEKILTHLEKLL